MAGALRGVLGFVGLLWGLEAVDWVLPADLDLLGIFPRDTGALLGILLAPLLHVGFGHVAANTAPLAVMAFLLLTGGGWRRFWRVSLTVALVGGLGTWLVGQPGTVHLGASILVFGYFGYLVTHGALVRRAGELITAALVAVLYGSMLLGVLPLHPGVSWEGHLFGLIGGLLAAWRGKRR